jgi:NlpC/P60 family/Bacterial dipeptidyl-peptidase Sh3 domain
VPNGGTGRKSGVAIALWRVPRLLAVTKKMTIAARPHFTLSGTSIPLDPRVHAVRGDLADLALAGQIFVPHYARPKPMCCNQPSAKVIDKGAAEGKQISELIFGEEFMVVDIAGDYAWGYCRHDHYVGYVNTAALAEPMGAEANSVVTVREALLHEAPSLESNTCGTLPMGARIKGAAEGDFIKTDLGYIALKALDWSFTDAAAVAETLVDVPYVWGGRSGFGIDCSGLVQIALALSNGGAAPRDTDQQFAQLGQDIPSDVPLRRGDLIFLPGHIGIMVDGTTLVHANMFHEKTVIEPLAVVVSRYETDHEGVGITGRKRLSQ